MAKAKSYAKKTGKKMVKRKKRWSITVEKDFLSIILQSEHPVSPRSLLYLLRKEIKCALFDLETQICELENQNLHGVNPSEQDISAMRRSLN
jgi:hypothetical protein